MVSKGQSSLSRIIGKMQKMGLVTRIRPLDNARLVEIDLTTAGEALADELMPIAIHFENVISEPMSEDQIEMLKSMLRQIYGQISKLWDLVSELGHCTYALLFEHPTKTFARRTD